MDTDPRRRFTPTQRAALALSTDGRCSGCGQTLLPGWHGDHVIPHARGGATTTANGQPLCPSCNLTKGATMPTGTVPCPDDGLRAWQRRALDTFEASDRADFLAVACPGAGKTTFALTAAARAKAAGTIDRVVVVVPTDHLKGQWADAAAKFGIDLAPDWRNSDGVWPADFDGVAITYAQLGRLPDLIARHVASGSTLAVLDEVHHAGDGQDATWGRALRVAFDRATRRLLLSGTPFRTDGTAIPFVTYDDERVCVPDHAYGYGHAVADRVCRPVVFPQYEGTFEWLEGSATRQATFDDLLDPGATSRRLRTALDPDGDFLSSLLDGALRQLARLRDGDSSDGRAADPDAGGLVLCMDQDHAAKVADLLTPIAGQRPVVATSDDPDASAHIARFARGRDPWLIAVRMVSEGVDIPRLRVLAYTTNVVAPLTFQQAIGRVVRVRAVSPLPDHAQDAFVYLPDDPRLREQAARIRHPEAPPLAHTDGRPEPDEPAGADREPGPAFLPVGSTGTLGGILDGNDRYVGGELARARRLGLDHGFPDHPDVLARLARMLRAAGAVADAPAETGEPAVPKHRRRERLRDQVSRLARRIALAGELEFPHVHRTLNEVSGCAGLAQATEDQLRTQVDYAQAWLRRLDRAA